MSEELNPKLEELKKKRRLHLKSKEENNDDAHEMFAQQHSDKGQFIFEILQNAEDSEASYVRFDVRNDDLEIRHDGKKVFQYEDVYSITTMGHSTKKNGVNQIGKFGVGFKAVFNITDCPIVHSGKYHFKIEKYIVPETVDPIDIGKETVFIFPFKSGNAKKSVIENCEKIKTKSENLLFLKNIKEVTFFYNGEERKLKIEKSSKEIPEPHRNRLKVTEATAKDEEGSWSFLIIESNEEIPETSHKVQIAFQKEKNKFVEIEMPVFVFFPTSKQSGLSFLVQAPYKTTPSRENIPFGDKENKEITKEIGKLIANSLPLIRDLNLLTPEFFDLLPLASDDEETHEPYATAHKAVMKKFEEDNLIPGYEKDTYLYLKESLSGTPEVIPLVNPEEVKKGTCKWVSPDISQRIINLLTIEEFTLQNLAEKIDETFIKTKNYKWLDNLYKALTPIKHYRDSEKFKAFATKPIVPLKDGERYISPLNSEDKPQIFMPHDEEEFHDFQSSFNIIDPKILEYENAKKFFEEELKIDKPKRKDDIEKSILPRYKKTNPPVCAEQYSKDILFIANAYDKSNDNEKEQIAKLLKNVEIILTEKDIYSAPEDTYLPNNKILKWFDGNEKVKIAKELDEIQEKKDKIDSLFSALGCKKSIELFHKEKYSKGEPHNWQSTEKGFNPEFQIEGLDHSLANITMERSKILWGILLENHSFIKGILRKADTQKDLAFDSAKEETFSKAGEEIKNTDWLYDKEEKLIPGDCLGGLTFNDLHPDYSGDDLTRDKVIRVLGMTPETLTVEEHREKTAELEEKTAELEKENKELKEFKEKHERQQTLQSKSYSQRRTGSDSVYASDKGQDSEEWEPQREADGSSKWSLAKTSAPIQRSLQNNRSEEGNENEDSQRKATPIPKEVGRWGEKEVFLKLKEKHSSDEVIEVKWKNEIKEIGTPYDILIKKNGTPDIYVEVKSTIKGSPHLFEITGAQWNHARKCQNGEIPGEYEIYAVFHAGEKHSEIAVLKNPVTVFKEDKLDVRPLGLKLALSSTEI